MPHPVRYPSCVLPDSCQKRNFTQQSQPVLCSRMNGRKTRKVRIMSTKCYVRALAVSAFAVSLLPLASPVHAQSSPLLPLSGKWAGAGTVALASGTKERIRCRSNNQVDSGGTSVQLELRCASDSYKFELRSYITYSGGQVMGRASGSQIQATAAGQTFTAILAMNTRGNTQSITIRSPGSELSEASI